MNLSGEALGLAATVILSAFGVVAYVSRKFAELSTDMAHAFKRIDALEQAKNPNSSPARARKRR